MEHLNQYNVIFLNMQDFLSENSDIEDMQNAIEEAVLWDLQEEYPDIHYYKADNLIRSLMDIYKAVNVPFVFIIDEWDCIFREKQDDKKSQKYYLDFLRRSIRKTDFSP